MYDYALEMSEHYRGNHLLVPMGNDFTFMVAEKTFANHDRLIEYFNENYKDMTL